MFRFVNCSTSNKLNGFGLEHGQAIFRNDRNLKRSRIS